MEKTKPFEALTDDAFVECPPPHGNAAADQPVHQSYMEVFLSDKYRKFRLLKPLSIEEATTYNRMQTMTTFFQEGCLLKSVVMGAGGGVLGLLFGTFFFTMRPVDIDTTQTFRNQIRQSYKGFGTEVLRSAKGFAKIGFLYSLIDCLIAKKRAKQDMATAAYAGCLTGAALAWRSGPSGMAVGCAGFAAFSAVMEKWNPLAPSSS